MSGEQWAPVGVPGCSRYSVSDRGRVRGPRGLLSLRRLSVDGYPMVSLYSDSGEPLERYVHQLVAEAFIGDRPDGATVNHIDNTPSNNRAGNLEYVTQRANIRHAARQGRMGKLRRCEAQEIVRLYARGLPQALLARMFLIAPQNVYRLIHGQTWPDLDRSALRGPRKRLRVSWPRGVRP